MYERKYRQKKFTPIQKTQYYPIELIRKLVRDYLIAEHNELVSIRIRYENIFLFYYLVVGKKRAFYSQ